MNGRDHLTLFRGPASKDFEEWDTADYSIFYAEKNDFLKIRDFFLSKQPTYNSPSRNNSASAQPQMKQSNGKVTKKMDGGTYVGYMKDGKREGEGTFTYSNGGKYVGSWRNDTYNGQGTYFYKNGDKYVGNFVNGYLSGQGTYYFKSGGKYVGNFANGYFSGQGTRDYKNGDKYQGEWRNDKFNGQGTYFYKNGDKYIGQWKDGEKDGEGVSTFIDGTKYEGHYKNGKMEGEGTFYFKNGDKYQGTWKESKINGYGFHYYANGDKEKQYWEEGRQVKSRFIKDGSVVIIENLNGNPCNRIFVYDKWEWIEENKKILIKDIVFDQNKNEEIWTLFDTDRREVKFTVTPSSIKKNIAIIDGEEFEGEYKIKEIRNYDDFISNRVNIIKNKIASNPSFNKISQYFLGIEELGEISKDFNYYIIADILRHLGFTCIDFDFIMSDELTLESRTKCSFNQMLNEDNWKVDLRLKVRTTYTSSVSLYKKFSEILYYKSFSNSKECSTFFNKMKLEIESTYGRKMDKEKINGKGYHIDFVDNGLKKEIQIYQSGTYFSIRNKW